MLRVPCVAIVLENPGGEILLLLRDDKPDIAYPNHWTLAGGKVEDGEAPEEAAHRELLEETGLTADLVFWRRYDRQHPPLIVDQYVYTGRVNVPQEALVLGEGQAVRFFKAHDIKELKIGFGFDALLEEYLITHRR
jgi:8-oxo-dGTP diphosphatase